MLHHELIGGGHGKKMRDAQITIAQHVQCRTGLKITHQQNLTASVQNRIGVAIQAARVEQRQYHKLYGFRVDPRRHGKIDEVVEHHAMRDHRALGMARRAGCVHNHAHIIMGGVDGRKFFVCLHRLFVSAVFARLAHFQHQPDIARACQFGRGVGENMVMHQCARGRIV